MTQNPQSLMTLIIRACECYAHQGLDSPYCGFFRALVSLRGLN